MLSSSVLPSWEISIIKCFTHLFGGQAVRIRTVVRTMHFDLKAIGSLEHGLHTCVLCFAVMLQY